MGEELMVQPGQAVFRKQLLGFNRAQVLSYIERISNANAEKARALDETIRRLQEELGNTRSDRDAVAEKARQVCQELDAEKQRAEQAFRQAARLREEVKKAADETSLVRATLLAREKENTELKRDNSRLNQTIDSLTETLAQKEADLQQEKRQAEEDRLADRQKLQQLEDEARRKLDDADARAQALLQDAQAQAQRRRQEAEQEAQVIVARAKGERV